MSNYPTAKDPKKIGTYPAHAKSGGGYFFDEVLEYRVWVHPERGAEDLFEGEDYYYYFATYEEALDFSEKTKGAEQPLALVLQKEYIDEPEPGVFIHIKKKRVTEWLPEWLIDGQHKRSADLIKKKLAENAKKQQSYVPR